MKFVKGDAIAGIVIIIINLLGGLAVGLLQHDMPLGEATHTHSILTIGARLVSQIPATLATTAAGLLVTPPPAAADDPPPRDAHPRRPPPRRPAHQSLRHRSPRRPP